MPLNFPVVGYGLTNAFGDLKFNEPVAIASPPGDSNRIFVVEKGGRILVITNREAPTQTLFLLDPETSVSGEQGMLGLAFHPGFKSNGFFFVYATVTTSYDGVQYGVYDQLSRYTVDPQNANRALPDSKRVILAQRDNNALHNAGDIKFGPEGYLYLAIGYEGPVAPPNQIEPQSVDTDFFGAILRIDVDKRPGNLIPNPHPGVTTNYLVPADNPFLGTTKFNGRSVDPTRLRTELYAIGLRNPWKISFDGDRLYCADVGNAFFEEVNLIQPGGNYGWPFWEGTLNWKQPAAPLSFKPPLHAYEHSGKLDAGRCVIGGSVYRGQNIPQLSGAYVFGDYVSGRIWALRHNENAVTDLEILTGLPVLPGAPGITTFGVDPANGDLLVAEYGGKIYRLIFVRTNNVAAPLTLAETGAFADTTSLTPNAGIVPYQVSAPFWSDDAIKRRWFSLPDPATAIGFAPTSSWAFPTGSVWIKHFNLELTKGDLASRKRVETRFLVKNTEGVYGVTYRWGDSRTDAQLVPDGGMEETFTIREGGTNRAQVWTYPSRSDCLKCHNAAAGYVLGFNTPQLNCTVSFGTGLTNQIDWLNAQGYFSNRVTATPELPRLSDPMNISAPIEHRVRSYLHANCSSCHHPDGPLANFWNARITTPMHVARIVDGHSFTASGDFKILKPGDVERSVMLHRLTSHYGRMPPLASTLFDRDAILMLREYVLGLPTAPWKAEEVGGMVEGSSSVVENEFRLAGRRSRFSESTDSFHFLHQSLSGNAQISGRFLSSHSEANAGPMFRADASSNAPFGQLSFESGGIRWGHRTGRGDAAQSVRVSDNLGSKWWKIARSGQWVRAYLSDDGVTWAHVGEALVELGSNALAGVAISAPVEALDASATFKNVSSASIQLATTENSAVPLSKPVILRADAVVFGDSIQRVEFLDGNVLLGEVRQEPYEFFWTHGVAGVRSIFARAVLKSGESVLSEPLHIERVLPPSRLAANAVDAKSKGNWKRSYGHHGYVTAGDHTNLPPWITFSTSGGLQVHAKRTTQKRALRLHKNQSRRAASIAGSDALMVNLGLLDGQLHRVSLYFLDWRKSSKSVQTVEISDAESGVLLDSRTISNFYGGVYATYTVRGAIKITIRSLTGSEPVLSGIFVDAEEHEPPSIEILTPAMNQHFISPQAIEVLAETSVPEQIVEVEFFANESSIGRSTNSPFQVSWISGAPGTYSIVAKATDRLGAVAESEPIVVTVSLPTSIVDLIRTDSVTRGQWMDSYGAEGFAIPGYTTNLPTAAVLALGANYTRVYFTEYTSRELEIMEGDGQILSIWRISGATDLKFIDGENHLLSFYFVDVERNHIQTITFRDGNSGEQLFSTNLPAFGDGIYYVFRVRGHVQFELGSQWGREGILSGIFLDKRLWTEGESIDSIRGPRLRIVDGKPTLTIRGTNTSSTGAFALEVSEDLNTWRPAGPEWIQKERIASEPASELIYQSTQPVSERERLFIRLRPAN